MGKQRPTRAKRRQRQRLAKRKLRLLCGLVLSQLSAWAGNSVAWGKPTGALANVLVDPMGSHSFGLHREGRHLAVYVNGDGFITLHAQWLNILPINMSGDGENGWTWALQTTADTIDNLLRYGTAEPSAVDLLGGISCPG